MTPLPTSREQLLRMMRDASVPLGSGRCWFRESELRSLRLRPMMLSSSSAAAGHAPMPFLLPVIQTHVVQSLDDPFVAPDGVRETILTAFPIPAPI